MAYVNAVTGVTWSDVSVTIVIGTGVGRSGSRSP